MTALLITCIIAVAAVGFAFLAGLVLMCVVIAKQDSSIDLPEAME